MGEGAVNSERRARPVPQISFVAHLGPLENLIVGAIGASSSYSQSSSTLRYGASAGSRGVYGSWRLGKVSLAMNQESCLAVRLIFPFNEIYGEHSI